MIIHFLLALCCGVCLQLLVSRNFAHLFTPGVLSSLVISQSRSRNGQHKVPVIFPFPKPGGLRWHPDTQACGTVSTVPHAGVADELNLHFRSITLHYSLQPIWIKHVPQKQAYITLKFTPNTSQSHWTYPGRWSSWWEVLMPLHDCGKMLSVCPWKLSSSVCNSSVSASWVWEIRTGITAGHCLLYLQLVIVLYVQLVTVCCTWNWSSCVVLAIGHCVVLAIGHSVVLEIGHCVLYLKLVIVCCTCNWSLCVVLAIVVYIYIYSKAVFMTIIIF